MDGGATISPQVIQDAFRLFLQTYTEGGSAAERRDLIAGDGMNDSDDENNNNNQLNNNTTLPFYVSQAHDLERTNTTTMYIDFKHLQKSLNPAYLEQIEVSWQTLEDYLTLTLRDFLHTTVPDYFPKHDTRSVAISLYGTPHVHNVRELKPESIGQLTAIQAMATKSTKVSPEVLIGAFRCRDCDAVIKNVRQYFKITLPTQCINQNCTNKRFFDLLPQHSTFSNWQQLTVQESTDNLPAGSVPRTIKVILRNELVEVAKPGDHCIITGTLIAIPDVASLYSHTSNQSSEGNRPQRDGASAERPTIRGTKELGVRDMSYKTALLATNVTRLSSGKNNSDAAKPDSLLKALASSSFDNEDHSFTHAELQSISAIRSSPNPAQLLVNSIAPSIYGHDTVKKGILFMLLGGVHKTTKDNASLRGDLNVLLIGDPSTAKSTFLKFVSDLLPRAVFTSGKASTAAGLTASVTRDSDSGEFVIEAGALMLADNGVCCIDEFDKMDQKDQSAIHEAMEQQTISIAKAGIQATLNARTSILAAANPLSGRYDVTRTLKQNVNITPPIMSRFDLYFILTDTPNEDTDRMIAKHMIATHLNRLRNTRQKVLGDWANADGSGREQFDGYLATVPTTHAHGTAVSTTVLRAYIRYAKQINPTMTTEAQELIIKKYADLRQRDLLGSTTSSYRFTVRQLESLIRLSEACARMHLSPSVNVEHVKEAADLLYKSIVNVKPSASVLQFDANEVPDDDDDEKQDDDDDDALNANAGDDNDDDKKGPGGGGNGGGGGRGNGGGGGGGDNDGDNDDNDAKQNKKRKRGAGYKDDASTTTTTTTTLDPEAKKTLSKKQSKQNPEQTKAPKKKSELLLTEYRRVALLVCTHLQDLMDAKIAEEYERLVGLIQEKKALRLKKIKEAKFYSDLGIDDDAEQDQSKKNKKQKKKISDHPQTVEDIEDMDNIDLTEEVDETIPPIDLIEREIQVISQRNLLNWVIELDPLKDFIAANEPITADENTDLMTYQKQLVKQQKFQKKVYKLILRRMMTEDRSIIVAAWDKIPEGQTEMETIESVQLSATFNLQHALEELTNDAPLQQTNKSSGGFIKHAATNNTAKAVTEINAARLFADLTTVSDEQKAINAAEKRKKNKAKNTTVNYDESDDEQATPKIRNNANDNADTEEEEDDDDIVKPRRRRNNNATKTTTPHNDDDDEDADINLMDEMPTRQSARKPRKTKKIDSDDEEDVMGHLSAITTAPTTTTKEKKSRKSAMSDAEDDGEEQEPQTPKKKTSLRRISKPTTTLDEIDDAEEENVSAKTKKTPSKKTKKATAAASATSDDEETAAPAKTPKKTAATKKGKKGE